jgi:hypothetical protein
MLAILAKHVGKVALLFMQTEILLSFNLLFSGRVTTALMPFFMWKIPILRLLLEDLCIYFFLIGSLPAFFLFVSVKMVAEVLAGLVAVKAV